MARFADLSQTEQDRLETAARWRLQLQRDDSRNSADFLEWMRNSDNRAAFALVGAGLQTVDQFQASPELLTMRKATLNRATRLGARRWRTAPRLRIAAAAALVLAAIASGGLWWLAQPTAYATGIGERRSIGLEDGSRISLDSDTEVRVRFTKNARNLELVRGRARFDVAHDVARPFSVAAGAETVVAVGTAFDVERLGRSVLVTLIQGRVVVKSAGAQDAAAVFAPASRPKPPVVLTAGQQLTASVDAKPVVAPADLHVATAWEAGKLVFHDETLAQAVEQVNRYAAEPISVDPAIAPIRVTGVFNAGDVNSFLTTVTTYLPIVASTTSDNRVLLTPRPKGG